jgi:polyhydroxyalkanoate synthase
MFSIQKKFIQGIETIFNAKDPEKIGTTPKELVYQEDKMKLYRYKPIVEKPHSIPILIVYALVNRPYMMDLQPDRSMIKGLLESGLDVYIVDWGYPTREDMYLTMADYINGYMNNCIDHILETKGINQLSLIGICQGGTFSAIYSALHPQKIKNLVTMVTPIQFDIDDGLLFKWSKYLNIDNMVETYGNVPDFVMNYTYLMLKPFQLMLDKYVYALENMDNPSKVKNFLKMEKWIFDSPDQAGETLREFVNDLYQDNKLIKGMLEIDGEKVDLKKITMPLLNMYAEYDHIIPPSSSIPFNDFVSSTDKTLYAFPVGHIGMFVSSKSKKEIIPKMASWLIQRSK